MMENISWGISLSSLEHESALPRTLPECFSLVEMPGFTLEPLKKKQLKLSYSNITELYFRELLEPTVTREIFSQSTAIRDGLKSHIRKTIEDTGDIRGSGIMLDFGIERCFNNPELTRKVSSFINGLSHSLYHSETKLLLPVRVPLPEELDSAEPYLEFLKKLMLPQVGFSVDIHPHELAGKKFTPRDVMSWLEFDTVLLRFVYEPQTGNRLVHKSLAPWLEACREHCGQLRMVLSPLSRDRENIENELNLLAQLISGLNNP